MHISKIKIHNFRSVQDTSWIEISKLTCLVGKNEAGKTNFLTPLWKFNPAINDSASKLNPKNDYPRANYANFKGDKNLLNEPFVSILFNLELDYESFNQIINEGVESNLVEFTEKDYILIEKYWNGNFYFFKSNEDAEKLTDDLCNDTKSEKYTKLIELIPKFIYYSEYGNLDSSIYLPTIQEKMNSDSIQVTEKEKMKIRTIKTLFEFTKINIDDITELGKENNPQFQNPKTSNEIEKEATNKKERDILLSSASNNLTTKFNEWWKQGEYTFRMKADGNYFRIDVSDKLRKEEIELEYRSKGLQWFFSFYLVFLVESEKSHQNCILLLDEPGLSLHPNAQKNLISFFEILSNKNQLIYTTHLPFLVDYNNLNQIVGIFIDKKGISKGSNDLTKIDNGDSTKSIQPVNSAIGISAAESLLYNCQIVIVEGISDQFYLSIIKSYLISLGEIKPRKDIIFLPVKGTKSIPNTVSIIQGASFELPFVLVDGDISGLERAKSLKKDFYSTEPEKVLIVDEITIIKQSEIEDLINPNELIKIFDKIYPSSENDNDFESSYKKELPIVAQMEAYAKENEIELLQGWKTEISKRFKSKFDPSKVSDENKEKWTTLFNKFIDHLE